MRQFALQPIVGPHEQGVEALFRTRWTKRFSGDPDMASRIMLDNWLLFGFEEQIGGRTVFLNCTRETLLSGFLSLLPRSAVLEILETVEPDREVLTACRALKAEGYRIALDDFESPENMEPFFELADFVKVDFRRFGRRERGQIRGSLPGETQLIAEKLESRDEFRQAVEEGFDLFQGYWVGQCMHCSKRVDMPDPIICTRIESMLDEPAMDKDDLFALLCAVPGIGCRILRYANWMSKAEIAITSVRDALDVVEKADLKKIIALAWMAGFENEMSSALAEKTAMTDSADPLIRWVSTGAQTAWWCDMKRGRAG